MMNSLDGWERDQVLVRLWMRDWWSVCSLRKETEQRSRPFHHHYRVAPCSLRMYSKSKTYVQIPTKGAKNKSKVSIWEDLLTQNSAHFLWNSLGNIFFLNFSYAQLCAKWTSVAHSHMAKPDQDLTYCKDNSEYAILFFWNRLNFLHIMFLLDLYEINNGFIVKV